VAYDNLQAFTECDRLGWYSVQGKAYNTTIGYKPEDLSTSQCFLGQYKQINYTEMQYPPPNSMLTDCYHPGEEMLSSEYNNPSLPSSSPIFSYPPGINLLISSWKSCTVSQLGAYDPPRTLNKATAMVPMISSPTPAAPASTLSPAHVPATPTPASKNIPNDPSKSANAPADPVDPGQSSDPKANSGSGGQQDPQQSNSQQVNPPKPKVTEPSSSDPPTQNPPNINDPPSNNSPSSNDPNKASPNSNNPSNNEPSNNDPNSNNPSNNGPSNKDPNSNDPSKAYPSSNDPSNNDPSNNDPSKSSLKSDNTSNNGSPANGQPTSNKYPSSNPSSNDPSNNKSPKNDPSNNDPNSVVANPIQASSQINSQGQGVPSQSPSSAAANAIPTPGLGAQIASAFGYAPEPTAESETNAPNFPVFATEAPNSGPQDVQAVANGSPTPLVVGGSPVQKASDGAIVVAGQTVAQGSQAMISGVAVSVGSNDVAIQNTVHNFSPLAAETPTPLLIGGHTVQRGPNGGLVIASQAITAGAQATVAGDVVSVGSDNAILNGAIYSLVPTPPTPVSVVVNGITEALQPGIADASKAPAITVAGQEFFLSQGSPYTNAAGQVITPGAPGHGPYYIIAGQTLSPGGAAITVSGTPISLPAAQTLAANFPAMVVGESAIQVGGPTPVTVGNQVFTPNPSAFVVGGTTISAGGPGVQVAGTEISLLPSGSGLVIASSTLPLSFQAGASPGSGGGSVNATATVGSMTSSGVTSSGTPSSVQSSSGDSVGTSSTGQIAQITSVASSRASAARRRGSLLMAVAGSLAVGASLGQWLL